MRRPEGQPSGLLLFAPVLENGAMDQVFARDSVIAPERLRQLSRRSDARGWLQLLSHFGAIGVTGAAIHMTLGTVWVAAPFLAHGVLVNYLYGGQHELSHSTVFRTRWLNEVFGRLIGFIVIAPRDADQIQHFAHHRHTQIWHQDGELFRDRFTLRSYLLRLAGIQYWYANAAALLLYAFGVVNDPYVKPAQRTTVIREARLHLAGYGLIAAVSVAAGSWTALLYWLAPLLLTKAAHQLQNLIEHVGLPHSDDIFANTRSTRTNAVMRWMCWQMQYHTAHHAFPSVPCYRLKELHAEIFTARGTEPPMMTYFGFQSAIIGALRLKGEADHPDDRAWIGSK
jgi:fatty acid desaturase